MEERVTIEPGDFFETVPAGGDAYVLSHLMHDWDEDQCLTILGHCRNAMKPDGRPLSTEDQPLLEAVERLGLGPTGKFVSGGFVVVLSRGNSDRPAQVR